MLALRLVHALDFLPITDLFAAWAGDAPLFAVGAEVTLDLPRFHQVCLAAQRALASHRHGIAFRARDLLHGNQVGPVLLQGRVQVQLAGDKVDRGGQRVQNLRIPGPPRSDKVALGALVDHD